MRIYAVADVHGQAAKIDMIQKTVSEFKPDVLVIAGDITNFRRSSEVIEAFNKMPAPVLAIRGNTDQRKVDHLLEQYPNTVSLHLKRHTLNGVGFVGVGGTVPLPFRSRLSIREKRIISALEPLVNRQSVLVAHPPPLGILDEALDRIHVGCHGLRQLIVKLQPKLLLCGHIHEHAGTASLGRTIVVNCSIARACRGALVEMNPADELTVEMLS